MTALAESNTSRYWVDYSDGVNDHSLMVRFQSIESSAAAAGVVLKDYLEAMDTDLYLITILGARTAVSGSNVTNPASWPGAATYGAGAITLPNVPRQVMFEGRDSSGHRWRLSQFATLVNTPNNYRISVEDDAQIAAAVDVLAAAFIAHDICSINRLSVTMKGYASFNYNNHFEAKARG
jgi:hypothetical protein